MSKVETASTVRVPKIFIVCDRSDTAPVWGYILRQQGLIAILETSVEKSLDHWSAEASDLVVMDIDVTHPERLELYKKFRSVSVAPIILFLPVHHETQILDAYAAGVDEVVVKPISPPIFLAKIMAWVRRSWSMPMDGLGLVHAGRHRLDPTRRCIVDPNGAEINLTNLEFRLMHLLMSQPGKIIGTDDLVNSIWGGFGNGDHVLLKNIVYRVRKKIEKDPGKPTLLQTWPGGYSFQG